MREPSDGREFRAIFLMLLLAGLIGAVFTGCATVTKPDSPAQSLAYVDGQFTALVDTAADLRQQGQLTDEQVEDIDPIIQKGDTALDAAWEALDAGDTESVLGYVKIVNSLATRLSQELSHDDS